MSTSSVKCMNETITTDDVLDFTFEYQVLQILNMSSSTMFFCVSHFYVKLVNGVFIVKF